LIRQRSSAAYLKFLQHKRRIRSRNFKLKAALQSMRFASANDFSTFVKVDAAT